MWPNLKKSFKPNFFCVWGRSISGRLRGAAGGARAAIGLLGNRPWPVLPAGLAADLPSRAAPQR